METYGWRKRTSVEQWLYAEPWKFNFYRAVAILEKIHPDRLPVGDTVESDWETVRFKQHITFAFMPSSIYNLKKPANEDEMPVMDINFIGLNGPRSPLPYPITELLLERMWKKDYSMKDFFDIFNHRITSLLFRVKRYHRVALQNKKPEETNLATYFKALNGMGLPSLQNRMPIDDKQFLGYTGLLTQSPRSAQGLLQMLSHHFNVRFEIDHMMGKYRTVIEDDLTIIGIEEKAQNHILGDSVLLGRKIWDQVGAFLIHIHNLTYAQYCSFLPSGDAYTPLSSLTQFYASEEFDISFNIHLNFDQIPPTKLVAKPKNVPKESHSRLGWNAWLTSTSGKSNQNFSTVLSGDKNKYKHLLEVIEKESA